MTLKEIQGIINYAPGFDEMQKKLLRAIVEAAYGYTDAEVAGNTPPSISIATGEGVVVSDGDNVAIIANEVTPGAFVLDLIASA